MRNNYKLQITMHSLTKLLTMTLGARDCNTEVHHSDQEYLMDHKQFAKKWFQSRKRVFSSLIICRSPNLLRNQIFAALLVQLREEKLFWWLIVWLGSQDFKQQHHALLPPLIPARHRGTTAHWVRWCWAHLYTETITTTRSSAVWSRPRRLSTGLSD